MNKTILSILLNVLIWQSTVLLAMNYVQDEKSEDLSSNILYRKSLFFTYNHEELAAMEKTVELCDAAGVVVKTVNLPYVPKPFAIMKEAFADIEAIDEPTFTLENNGFEVLDFSDDDDFMAILTEFYSLDYARTPEVDQDNLKRRFSQQLKIKLDQWLATQKGIYGQAKWTAIRATDVAVRHTGKRLEGDKRQEPLPLLHCDYPNADEFRRYVNLRNDNEKVNPHPQADFVSYVNIWAPTDEIVGGTPLAVLNTATIKSGDYQDVVVAPEIDGVEKPELRFIGRSIKFDHQRHKLYSVENWKRGKIIVFHTFTTPHTALLVDPSIPRNSVELRGFIWANRVE